METSEFRVPDVIGEIVGWRAWRVIGGNVKLPMLASVTHSRTIWHPDRWTHATCSRIGNRGERGVSDSLICRACGVTVPGEGCTCGLYAAKSRAQLVRLGYNREPKDARWPVFIGEVGLAGKVIPGTQGWRAEKGRIVRLYVPYHQFKWIETLEALYRVPVLLDNTLRA